MKIFKVRTQSNKKGVIQMPKEAVGKFYIRECNDDIITFKEVKKHENF